MVPSKRSRRGIAPLAIVALLAGGFLLFTMMQGQDGGGGGPLASLEHIGDSVGGLLEKAVDGVSGLVGDLTGSRASAPVRPSYSASPYPPPASYSTASAGAPFVTVLQPVIVPSENLAAAKVTQEVAKAAVEAAVEPAPVAPAGAPGGSSDLVSLKAAVDQAFEAMQAAVRGGDREAIAATQVALVRAQADWQVARVESTR